MDSNPFQSCPGLLTIKLGQLTDVPQLRSDWNCLAHFHVGLSGRTINTLKSWPLPEAGINPWAPDPKCLGLENSDTSRAFLTPQFSKSYRALAWELPSNKSFPPKGSRRKDADSKHATHPSSSAVSM